MLAEDPAHARHGKFYAKWCGSGGMAGVGCNGMKDGHISSQQGAGICGNHACQILLFSQDRIGLPGLFSVMT